MATTIGELERKAGITDRSAFWAPFARIAGTFEKDGKLHSVGFDNGVAELRRLAECGAGAAT